jgi:lysozyme
MTNESECGVNLIKQFEGCKLKAYHDQGGVLTVGYGHTGVDVYEGMTITQEQADALLEQDLKATQNAIDRLVNVPLTNNQNGALLSFVYNIGQGNFKKSTLLKRLNAGQFEMAAAQFPAWDKVNGLTNTGLLRRRIAEKELFNNG